MRGGFLEEVAPKSVEGKLEHISAQRGTVRPWMTRAGRVAGQAGHLTSQFLPLLLRCLVSSALLPSGEEH